jgi:hypothetical protein
MRGEGVAECVDARPADAHLGHILPHQLLHRSWTDGLAELGHEEGVGDLGPRAQQGLERPTGLEVERDPARLAPLGQDVQSPHRLRVAGDALRELDVTDSQAGQLGKANAGLQQQLDDGAVAGMLTARAQERYEC